MPTNPTPSRTPAINTALITWRYSAQLRQRRIVEKISLKSERTTHVTVSNAERCIDKLILKAT